MQVKNKPCMIFTVMRLILGNSETLRQRILTCFVKFCHFSSKMLLFKAIYVFNYLEISCLLQDLTS